MNTKQGRILVVDDDPDVRLAFETTLHHKGYQADSAQCGTQALTLLEENTYDIVLVDLRMPKMDGLATISAIKKNAYPTQTILMTGTSMSDQIALAIKQGVDGILYKPFQVDQIVQNLLSGNPVKLHTCYLQSVWRRISPVIGTPTAQAVFQKMLDNFHEEHKAKFIQVSLTHEGFLIQQTIQEAELRHPANQGALRHCLRHLLAEVYILLNTLTGDILIEPITQDLSNLLKKPPDTIYN